MQLTAFSGGTSVNCIYTNKLQYKIKAEGRVKFCMVEHGHDRSARSARSGRLSKMAIGSSALETPLPQHRREGMTGKYLLCLNSETGVRGKPQQRIHDANGNLSKHRLITRFFLF